MRERVVAAAGGAAFVVISLATGPLLPQPPSGHPGGALVASYFAEHHSALVAGSVLAAVAAVAVLSLLVALGALTGGIAGRTVQAAGSVLVGVALLGAVLQAGLAAHAADLDHATLLAAFTIERAVFYTGPALATALVALAAATGRFPAWYRALCVILGALGSVGAVTQLAWDNRTVTDIGFGGFLLTVVWVALTTVVVLRTSSASVPDRSPVSPPRDGVRPNGFEPVAPAK